MEVFFPVTEAVEIGKYAAGFFFRERNDRVLVERNDAYAQQHMTVDRDGGADEIRCGNVGENGYICKGFIIGL